MGRRREGGGKSERRRRKGGCTRHHEILHTYSGLKLHCACVREAPVIGCLDEGLAGEGATPQSLAGNFSSCCLAVAERGRSSLISGKYQQVTVGIIHLLKNIGFTLYVCVCVCVFGVVL